MTDERLAEIKALLAGATPGPWSCTITREEDTSEFHDPLVPPVRWEWEVGTDTTVVLDGIEYGRPEYDPSPDITFIAAAPAIVAELLGLVMHERIGPRPDASWSGEAFAEATESEVMFDFDPEGLDKR